MLEKVAQGRMRLETVCEGPFSDEQRKRRLTALVGPNLPTLRVLLSRTVPIFRRPSRRGARTNIVGESAAASSCAG